ncbi:MAG: 16S rRNA (cytidine(1402)-2'-O)-methyltransferase [Pseudomonadota bacterium]
MAILYIVATPIGNLKDITLRALETLAAVDIIAAEDTRVAKKLLTAHGINKPLLSYHQHNAAQRDSEILSKLNAGQDIALVTDAGTPLISDPGYSLVNLCRTNGFDVTPIPGVSALITALSVNEFNAGRFFFEGFLPPKKSARIQRLEKLMLLDCAVVLYEAKHRVIECLEDIENTFGSDRKIMIARELTKLHEQIVSGTLKQLIEKFRDSTIPCKGEYVILLQGDIGFASEQVEERKIRVLFEKVAPVLTHRDAVELGLKLSSLQKNALYTLAKEFYEHK